MLIENWLKPDKLYMSTHLYFRTQIMPVSHIFIAPEYTYMYFELLQVPAKYYKGV